MAVVPRGRGVSAGGRPIRLGDVYTAHVIVRIYYDSGLHVPTWKWKHDTPHTYIIPNFVALAKPFFRRCRRSLKNLGTLGPSPWNVGRDSSLRNTLLCTTCITVPNLVTLGQTHAHECN